MFYKEVAVYSKIISLLCILSFPILTGCNEKTTSDGDIIACTEEFVPGIRVNVFDKETGFPSACGAKLIIYYEDGTVEEMINYTNDCEEDFTFAGAYENEGVYDIKITKEGYMDWNQLDVQVTANLCHVNTITLQAYIEK